VAKYTKKLRKITPFKYPSKQHKRTESPPDFSSYRDYKPYLKKEFENKCVYCRRCDNDYVFSDKGDFQVEHYRPKSLFPHLLTEYSNLFYSCASCNRFKSNYWEERPNHILNPCDDVMNQHLAFNLPYISAKSKSGELLIRQLKLNGEREQKYRDFTNKLIIEFLLKLNTTKRSKNDKKIEDALEHLSWLVSQQLY